MKFFKIDTTLDLLVPDVQPTMKEDNLELLRALLKNQEDEAMIEYEKDGFDETEFRRMFDVDQWLCKEIDRDYEPDDVEKWIADGYHFNIFAERARNNLMAL